MYADLHRHLDGSLRPQTFRDLAAAVGLPTDVPRFRRGMGLAAALDCFRTTLALLQTPAALCRVAAEMAEDAAREGVTTLEVRFAPQLHGDDPTRAVDAVLDGLGGRAGLILCGLYGEPPAVLERLVEVGRERKGVVGIDLAGGPLPDHRWRLPDYAPPFLQAERAGLGRTLHAGEGRPPAEIAVAVEVLHAQRIGHGTTLLDDPAVLELVLARGITIEACLTSNVHVGAIESVADHPVARWLDAGVQVAVCTDNTLLSDVDAPTEHAHLTAAGVTADGLQRILAHGHAAAFRRA